MNAQKYLKQIEEQIAEHQVVQQNNPPTSSRWLEASKEIHRLAALITGQRGVIFDAPQAVKDWRKEHPEEFLRLSEKGPLTREDALLAFQVWQQEHPEAQLKLSTREVKPATEGEK